MRAGFVALTLGYALSQFYRAFLAVLSPILQKEIGATPEDLAFASGMWFATFAIMQIPVGHALDSIGPRRTAGVLLLSAVAGAAVFATASDPGALALAMALIGIGCAPVLMSAFYIFARVFPPKVFASLGGLLIGVSSAGDIASTIPMAWAAETFGWRACLWAIGGLTAAVAVAILVLVRDPERLAAPEGAGGAGRIFRSRAVLLILPLIFVHYAPLGGIRGLWAGPYLAEIYGLDSAAIGRALLAMGISVVLGNLAYGSLDRLLGTRKRAVLTGNLLLATALLAIAAWPSAGLAPAVALLCAVGFFGASFPLLIAHGRSFFPAHLTGRAVSYLNLVTIGGAAVAQIASGRLHAAIDAALPGTPTASFAGTFLFFGLLVAAGCLPYAFSRDRLD
jgi:predicted MFS family arabinose efflux permease